MSKKRFSTQERMLLDGLIRDVGQLQGLLPTWHRAVFAKMAEFKDNGDGTFSIPRPLRLQGAKGTKAP